MVLNFCHLIFEFVSDFEIRISDLIFCHRDTNFKINSLIGLEVYVLRVQVFS